MMWHKQLRQTDKQHDDHWFHDTEENPMKEYIRRQSDESALAVLEELRRDAVSSKSFSCMFWNSGNWQRSRFARNPLPEHYRTHINFDFDSDHKLIGDKPLYNNFFVNVGNHP